MPRCVQCRHRTATMTARSMGGPKIPTCTRCAGSVLLRLRHGALVELLGDGRALFDKDGHKRPMRS